MALRLPGDGAVNWQLVIDTAQDRLEADRTCAGGSKVQLAGRSMWLLLLPRSPDDES